MKNNFSEKNKIQQLKDKIDVLTKTVSKLKNSEQVLTNAVDYAPIGMITLSNKGKFQLVNRAFCQITGYTKKELLTKNISQITHPDDKHIGYNVIEELKSGKAKKANFEKRYIHKKGNTIYAQVSTVILRDELGAPQKFFTQMIDITERLSVEQAGKQAEEKLKESERRLALAVDGAGLGLWDQDFSSGKTIRNERWAQMLGYELDEIEKSRSAWKELIHPDDLATLEKSIKEHKQGKSTIFSVEHRMRAKDGEWKWIHNWGRIVERDKNGRPLRAVGVHLDITDRKRAEEALLDSEARYRKFFMEDLTGDYLSTREGKIIDCNPQFLRIFGFKSLNQAQKYDIAKLYKSKSEREEFIKRLEKNKVLLDEQSETFKVNGEKIIIHENVSGEFNDDGKLINIRGYLYDITKRVKAEKQVKERTAALLESEERFRQVANASGEWIWEVDAEGMYTYSSPVIEKILGYRPEEVVGKKHFYDFFRPDEKEELKKGAFNVFKTKESFTGFINNNIHMDGHTVILETSAVPILDKNGKLLGYRGADTDITKRMNNISELMDREEKYRTLTQNLNVGVYRNTPGMNGIFIEVNPTFLKMFGFKSKNELERWKVVDLYPAPIERKSVEEKLASKGFLLDEEIKLRKKDGTIFFASISATSAKDDHGNITHYDGIIEDITERKEMMERIIQERDRSQLYLDIAGVMFIALDRKGNIILANQKTCEIIGTTEENLIGKNWVDNHIPKDIRLNVKNDFYNIMIGKAELAEYYEHEILTTSGEKRLIAWRNSTLKDGSGKIFGIISSGLDITESKEDEELRYKLYKTSRNLTESLNIDLVLNRISKQAMALLKCSSVAVYMLEEDKKTIKPVMAYDPPFTKEVLATKLMIDNSLTGQTIKAKTGKIFNYGDNIKGAFHIKGTPKTDTDNIMISPFKIDGEVIGTLNLIRSTTPFTEKDLSIVKTFAVYASTAIKNANSHKALLHEIDERKITKAQLKESHDRYQSIFNGAVDGIVYSDRSGKILSVNSAFTKLIGMKKADLIGKNGIQLAKQLSMNKSGLQFLKNILNGNAINAFPIEYNNRFLEIYTPAEKDKPGITVMVRDVTERNKARKNVELHQNNLATLSNELTMAEEKAKKRLAITLHDKLGQSLVLANFKANELNKRTKNFEHKKILNEISSFIEEALNESRNITYELSSPVLYEMGLVPAISLKLDDIEKANKIKTSLIDQSKSYEFEEREQIILYRSINELLQNVLKHSKAGNVNVSFRLLTNDYRITVSDNGIGFDLKAMRDKVVSQKKFGLFSIMERIRYIGGEVNINTIPNKGTKVVINLPIKN